MDKLLNDYMEGVTSGRLVVGRYQLLAVERHFKDLETGAERGLRFNRKAGLDAIKMVRFFRHVKGKWANKPFQLTGWQSFVVYCLFGWKKFNDWQFVKQWKSKDGQIYKRGERVDKRNEDSLPLEHLFKKKIIAKHYTRRFKKAFLEMAKKNGKTEFLAAIACVLMFTNKDENAEYYWAATSHAQASIGWDRQKSMTEKAMARSKIFKNKYDTNTKRILDKKNRSLAIPLAKERESNQKDGIGAKGGFIDEYHLHDDNYMITQLESSSGLYDEAIIFIITTAGFNPYCVCKEFEDYCVSVLEGTVENDTLFVLIFQIDEGDDWENPNVWVKSNPNLGASPNWEYMNEQYSAAKLEGGAALTTFKVKNLNIWTKNREIWIDIEIWQSMAVKYTDEMLRDLPCVLSVDLASKRDFCSMCTLFKLPNDTFYAKMRFWLPEATLKIRKNRQRGVDFEKWIEKGWISTFSGNYRDDNVIVDAIEEDFLKYNIKFGVFDRWRIEEVYLKTSVRVPDLELIPFGQGYKSMTAPTEKIERLINTGKLYHEGNKCMEWQLSNVAIKIDETENQKIDKKKSVDKVDGPVTMVMAYGGWLHIMNNVKDDTLSDDFEMVFG